MKYIEVFFLFFFIVIFSLFVRNCSKDRDAIYKDILSRHDSLKLASFEKKIAQRKYSQKYQENRTIETFPFDPNKCDSITFIRLGLPYYVAHNALQYRRKHGVWKSVEHFKHLYGLTYSDYCRLKPFVIIRKSHSESGYEKQIYVSHKYRNDKFTTIVKLDANNVDTTILKKIPGIGSYYAQKICNYRERLGGFISVRQVAEIEGLPEGIDKWFEISNKIEPKVINVNTASFKTLIRHPYLNYNQTCEIKNYIERFGPIHSWEDLSNSKYFSETDFEKLKPYFVFH